MIPMKIIKEKRIDNNLKIVLVERQHFLEPYGTLLYNEEFDGFASGNYFRTYEEAERDFEIRK